MNYLKKLKSTAQKSGSIACMGMDPVIEKIPITGSTEKRLCKFYLDILGKIQAEHIFPAAVKPNIAFFEQYGFEGLRALKTIIDSYMASGTLVILDAKRADIGKTSGAYAKALFEFWKADAVTTSPYMGGDSVQPFVEYCDKDKGVYILTRTSNRGAEDIQDIQDDQGNPIYFKTAQKIVQWYKPGIGSVVGATGPRELEKVCKLFSGSSLEIPLLIPGVGTQGADSRETMEILKSHGNVNIHRINSSSAINFAFEMKKSKDYAACAVDALSELIEQTRL